MNLDIAHDRCIGAGQCVSVAPDLFGQDEEGIVVLLGEIPVDRMPVVVEAIDVCPSGALRRKAV